MTALSNEQRARHHELAALLQSLLATVRELPDGYDFEFPWEPALYAALAEITPLEHACCPFFNISIRIESESNKLLLATNWERRSQAVYSRGVWGVVWLLRNRLAELKYLEHIEQFKGFRAH